jgi:hypothetical protein
MRAQRKLFLVVLTLCGYWLGLAPARALPVETLAQSLAMAGPLALEAKAKNPARKTAAKRGRKKPAANSGEPPVAAEPAVPIPTPPPPPPNLKLKAALAASGPAVTEGLGWRVLAERPAAGKADRIVWSGGGAEPSIHLDPGRYYVEASFGFARNGQDIEIAPDSALDARVVLNAGTILARGVAVAGGPPLDRMFYVLRRAEAAGAPTGEVGRSSLAQATFHVPAGAYRLALQHGLAKTEIPVVVAAGQETKSEGVLNAGHLKLGATATSGGPLLDNAVFFVYAQDASGNSQEIARSELRQAEFDLPAGRYRIAAMWGLARTERQITIKAGAASDETLVMDAGEVRMTSVLTGSDRPLDRQLIYKVYGLSSDPGASTQSIATSAKPSPTMHLKSGKYRIESQYGWHNARQTREVEVVAGETTDLVFEHRASEVKLKLAIAPGTPAPGRVKWTVKYANGGTVLISQDEAPSLILQAGSYQAVAQYGAKTYSRSFEANPNEVHVIELVAE